MPMFRERLAEIKAGLKCIKRQRALFVEMATVKPVADGTRNFGITPEQLEDFLESLNAELAADDLTNDDT
jgi:hypothetical protein